MSDWPAKLKKLQALYDALKRAKENVRINGTFENALEVQRLQQQVKALRETFPRLTAIPGGREAAREAA